MLQGVGDRHDRRRESGRNDGAPARVVAPQSVDESAPRQTLALAFNFRCAPPLGGLPLAAARRTTDGLFIRDITCRLPAVRMAHRSRRFSKRAPRPRCLCPAVANATERVECQSTSAARVRPRTTKPCGAFGSNTAGSREFSIRRLKGSAMLSQSSGAAHCCNSPFIFQHRFTYQPGGHYSAGFRKKVSSLNLAARFHAQHFYFVPSVLNLGYAASLRD
jgi:hypothetical protein